GAASASFTAASATTSGLHKGMRNNLTPVQSCRTTRWRLSCFTASTSTSIQYSFSQTFNTSYALAAPGRSTTRSSSDAASESTSNPTARTSNPTAKGETP